MLTAPVARRYFTYQEDCSRRVVFRHIILNIVHAIKVLKIYSIFGHLSISQAMKQVVITDCYAISGELWDRLGSRLLMQNLINKKELSADIHGYVYSRVRNKRTPTLINFLTFFPGATALFRTS